MVKEQQRMLEEHKAWITELERDKVWLERNKVWLEGQLLRSQQEVQYYRENAWVRAGGRLGVVRQPEASSPQPSSLKSPPEEEGPNR